MSSIRRFTLIGLLVGILGLGAVVAYAATYETETYYFSDPAHLHEVGWRIRMSPPVRN